MVNKLFLVLTAIFVLMSMSLVFSASPTFTGSSWASNWYYNDNNYYDFNTYFYSGIIEDADGDLNSDSCEYSTSGGVFWFNSTPYVEWVNVLDVNRCRIDLNYEWGLTDDLNLGFRVKDMVGNVSTASNVIFYLDNTAPTTSISNMNTEVTLTCTDSATSTGNGSGCETTTYRVDGGTWETYTAPFTVGEGNITIDYNSIDYIGNAEAYKTTIITTTIMVDLNSYTEIINNSALIGNRVTKGIADQGDLIGLGVGLSIAIVLIFGVVVVLLAFIVTTVSKTKKVGKK